LRALTIATIVPMGPAAAAEPAWWDVSTPSAAPVQAIGEYGRGCLGGAEALPLSGPGFEVMRPSRRRFYGHPRLIAFVRDLAAQAQTLGWPGLLIGDLAQPRGGPMGSGHASHQTGLDVDVWYLPRPHDGVSEAGREELSAVPVVADDGRSVGGAWTEGHDRLLAAAAGHPDVDRIFVHAAVKQALCEAGAGAGERSWLHRVRPWWGHDHHFHVRLRCPDEEGLSCRDQTPLPAGDGCDSSLAWWFSDEARAELAARAARPPARALTLAQLPADCREVLSRE
jgi:penicillin-insensitive murein endopeptidase